MRELKFRVWDNESKKIYNQDEFILTFDTVGEDVYLNKNNEVIPLYSYKLMQSTGLEDENGKEIYEGDILKTKDYYECGELIFKGKVFKVENIDFYINSCMCLNCQDAEIIGNIYENENLLK